MCIRDRQYAVHSNYAGVWSEQGKTRIAHQKILLGEGSFVELLSLIHI